MSLSGEHLTCQSYSSPASSASGPKLPTSAAAARHQEGILLQLAAGEGRENLLDIAAGLRNHVDPSRRQGHFQWPGDRTADQDSRACLGETSSPKLRVLGIEGNTLTDPLDAVGDLDDQRTLPATSKTGLIRPCQ